MDIREHVPLADYTTLKVGGAARYFCAVTTVEELETARQFAVQHDVPFLVIGSGSNLLVSDAGFAGVVAHNRIAGRAYQNVSGDIVHATFGAGEILDEVIADTVASGYWGLENLSHIPGTVGATPVQNVGAYGVEVGDIITTIDAVHVATGQQRAFTHSECAFSYRDSFFKTPEGRNWIITRVTFDLSTNPAPKLSYKDLAVLSEQTDLTQQHIRDAVIQIRSTKFPDWHTVGTAGSFFKNPVIDSEHAADLKRTYPDLPVYAVDDTQAKVSLAFILDKICGLKGYQKGDVRLYENQPLVLTSSATSATNIVQFAAEIASTVAAKTDIIIEQEVTTV